MKRLIYSITALLVLLSSCKKEDPFVYNYEDNPLYTWGYADFWGNYYSTYSITENVVSLSLFTDDLSVDSTSNLVGVGQYLFIEDIFIAPSDTLLPAGTYTVRDKTESFSITPGEEIEIDGQKFDVGAFVYFVEKNEMFTVMKFITAGTMKISYSGDVTRMDFDFTLDDKTSIKGKYEGQLPYFDSRFSFEEREAFARIRRSQQLNSFFFNEIQGKYYKRHRSYSAQ